MRFEPVESQPQSYEDGLEQIMWVDSWWMQPRCVNFITLRQPCKTNDVRSKCCVQRNSLILEETKTKQVNVATVEWNGTKRTNGEGRKPGRIRHPTASCLKWRSRSYFKSSNLQITSRHEKRTNGWRRRRKGGRTTKKMGANFMAKNCKKNKKDERAENESDDDQGHRVIKSD